MNSKRPTKSDCECSTTDMRDAAVARLREAGFDAGPANGSKKLYCNAGSDEIAKACGIVMAVDSGARMRHDPA